MRVIVDVVDRHRSTNAGCPVIGGCIFLDQSHDATQREDVIVGLCTHIQLRSLLNRGISNDGIGRIRDRV